MYKLLLIGNGNFGKNYVSTLANFNDVSLEIANRNNWKKLIDKKPDGVLVVTPPSSHIEIASYALSKDIPTMIEKPLSLSIKEAEILKQYTAPILVNHIHLFSDSYQYIKQNIKNITSIKSVGHGCNSHNDCPILWDYGPHDIAMVLDLAQQYPKSIHCSEVLGFSGLFDIKLEFEGFTSDSSIGQSTFKNRSIVVNNYNNTYYNTVTKEEPLTNALRVFIGAINGNSDYRLGLELSLNVMRVLEKCQEILNNNTFIQD